jgi:pimeloyl-ACP methyl ester carboxylesterase
VKAHGRAGTPLLLLHGFGLNGRLWKGWVPELSRTHRAFVVDLKGFGRAPAPRDGRYGPEDQASLVRRFILEENLHDLVLVGHSLGGAIALMTTLLLSESDRARIRGLVLVAGLAFPQPIPRYIHRAGRPILGRLLLRLIPPSLIAREALKMAYYDPGLVTKERIEQYAEPLRSPGGRYALACSARQLLPKDTSFWTSRYRDIDVPALLLWGSHDPVVPVSRGRMLQRALPRAKLEILDRCGHMPPEEAPTESLERVKAFLEGEGTAH